MSAKTEPSRIERLIGACVFVGISIAALALLLEIYDAVVGLAPASGERIGRALAPVVLGAAVAGWRWPRQAVRILKWPFSRLKDAKSRTTAGPLDTLLQTPLQRALFVAGCAGLVPWLIGTAVRQLWISDGVLDYLSSVFVYPVKHWFTGDWGWRYEWYEYPFLPAATAILLALVWPWTGSPILSWIKGKGRSSA